MRKIFLVLFALVSIVFLIDRIKQSDLEARPGGGSSYRSSSSSSSRSSSSSSRSSGSSSWSSSSSRSYSSGGGGGSGNLDGYSIGAFIFSIASFILVFAGLPSEKTPKLVSEDYIMLGIGLPLMLLAAWMGGKGTLFSYFLGMLFFIGPFVLVHQIYKHLFGYREEIYVAKARK